MPADNALGKQFKRRRIHPSMMYTVWGGGMMTSRDFDADEGDYDADAGDEGGYGDIGGEGGEF